ncbi:MAG: tetratricopeptide repeat protein [Polaribacter sp.]|nr:tetratricopeptide repeat protein [Polaribacter sp.]
MNVRFSIKSTFLLCCTFISASLFSQQSDLNVNHASAYNHAMQLYNNNAYAAAQKTFQEVATQNNNTSNLTSDSDYYAAMCAVKLNQTAAEKMVLNFVAKYPNSNKKEKAFLTIGNYYFANKKASYALKWYSKVNMNALSIEEQHELNFKTGYALLIAGNLTLAKKRFLPLINNPNYGNQSRYYYGYISYKQGDHDTAEAYLTEAAEDESYKNDVTYFLLDIRFKAGKFDTCIEIGKEIISKASQKEKSEISKIIGESYFNLKKYAESIPYLKAYKGKRGKWNNTDYYQLGYAFYKQNDFENAVKNFNKIIGEKNAVSQNAYYHLAESYLYLERKPEALNAFKSASEMNFNATIKEDASLNYAKLSYEEGNPYKSVAAVLQEFLTAYPKSPHTQKINKLIVTSYVHQQDYKGALTYLAKKKTPKNKALSKEISLYRGIQLFNQNKLQDSYVFFTKASQSSNAVIKTPALYWKAEIDFQRSNFQKALTGFIRFKKATNASKTTMFKQVDYHIAYSYFKLKEYSNAAVFFTKFLSKKGNNASLNDDAIIRLADCYFVTKSYSNAIKSYQTIITNKGVGADYAHYQKALSYGFIGQNSQKISGLLTLINEYTTSSLQDDALFQLANTYVAIKENEKAHTTYKRLRNKHTRSSYISRTLLRQGLLYYNDNQHQKALKKYKKIVTSYPNTNEAKEAVSNARNVYIDLGDIDTYASWVKTISFVNVTNADLDNTMYEAAENKFLENNTEKAIDGFTKYVARFPEGLHALKANFYAAQLLSKSNQPEKALPYYQFVTANNQNEFSEEALNKLAQIYLEKENWTQAIPLLIRLEQEANYPQNILFAQSNLMKGYYQSDQFKEAVLYAKKVLKKDNLNKTLLSDANIIIARSAFKTNDLTIAEAYYMTVEKTAHGEMKAEALYYSAYFKNQHKKFTASNKVVQNLIANYASYKYWGVKSYIIMAKNHYGLKDAYQATYILENIINNFTQFKDVITEAQRELKDIQAKEAKTNDSVTPKN